VSYDGAYPTGLEEPAQELSRACDAPTRVKARPPAKAAPMA